MKRRNHEESGSDNGNPLGVPGSRVVSAGDEKRPPRRSGGRKDSAMMAAWERPQRREGPQKLSHRGNGATKVKSGEAGRAAESRRASPRPLGARKPVIEMR